MFSRGPSKDDLKQQVVEITMETHKLKDKAQDLRNVFSELDEVFSEAQGVCFPFQYFMLRDMVHDANDVSSGLEGKWYGAVDDNSKKARGGVRRLLENCRELARQMNQYELIMEELSVMNKKGLEKVLHERQSSLAQQKVVFAQLQDLLKQLQDLHSQSQDRWFWPRYVMLRNGVTGAIAAFRSVAGLAETSTLLASDSRAAQNCEKTKER